MADEFVKAYEAVLDPDQIGNFFSSLYSLEVADHCRIVVLKRMITIETTEIGFVLLQASFKDGLLNTWGWDKSFDLCESSLTANVA